MVRRKAVCALIMSVAKLELASLTASAARPRTKKGDPIVPKGYSKANVSKELLQSGDASVGRSLRRPVTSTPNAWLLRRRRRGLI